MKGKQAIEITREEIDRAIVALWRGTDVTQRYKLSDLQEIVSSQTNPEKAEYVTALALGQLNRVFRKESVSEGILYTKLKRRCPFEEECLNSSRPGMCLKQMVYTTKVGHA